MTTTPVRPRRRALLGLTGVLFLAAFVTGVLLTRNDPPSKVALPLRHVSDLPLPGDTSRFDYASLDPPRGLLFIAHLGAGEIIEVDVHANRVVRTITHLPDVHGVLVVPRLHRVYATATGENTVAAIDEDTGQILTRTPTGAYPDGLAYDPRHNTVWTTNETGGSETVIDAATGAPRGTVPLGGEAGNVVYDPVSGYILADVQGRNTIAVIDPASHAVTRRAPLPGCDHDHGHALDPADRLAFIACDGNAALLTLDLNTWQITGHAAVGQDPDVLTYDPGVHRLYVAAESGWVTTLDVRNRHPALTGRAPLAAGAHVVAIDPISHRSYYPIARGIAGHPTLVVYEPASIPPSGRAGSAQ
jgi:DNA-binding beta-propeller fold protein YncE